MLGEVAVLLGGTAAGLAGAYFIWRPAPATTPAGDLLGQAVTGYWRLTEAEYQGIKNLMQRAKDRYDTVVRSNGNRPPTIWTRAKGGSDSDAAAAFVAAQGGNVALYRSLEPVHLNSSYGPLTELPVWGRMYWTPGFEKLVARYAAENALRTAPPAPRFPRVAPVSTYVPSPVTGYTMVVAPRVAVGR